jgi:hypothetical protein
MFLLYFEHITNLILRKFCTDSMTGKYIKALVAIIMLKKTLKALSEKLA